MIHMKSGLYTKVRKHKGIIMYLQMIQQKARVNVFNTIWVSDHFYSYREDLQGQPGDWPNTITGGNVMTHAWSMCPNAWHWWVIMHFSIFLQSLVHTSIYS